MRPNLLDSSAIIDGRIADLAEAGIFESRFAVPSCVVDDLQAAAESTDKLRRMRGRRGLDVLACARAQPRPAIPGLSELRGPTTSLFWRFEGGFRPK
jgi:uncharacterized protein YacL